MARIDLGNVSEYEPIAPMIAPHIIGNDLAKEVIGLMMLMNIKEEKFHTMLVGAYGSAKSELGVFVKKNMPNQTCMKLGKETTGPNLRGKMLPRGGTEDGLLWSSKGKIVFYDELDKTDKDTLNTLLEPMEERTVTVNGEEHDAVVNLIATANPYGGTWCGEPSLNQLPFGRNATLISRFYMFIPFFELHADEYKKLGRAFYIRDHEDIGAEIREKIRDAQSMPHISMTEEQHDAVCKNVGRLKRENDLFRKYITPRYVTGSISLCKAHARYRGRDHVLDEDISYVHELYERVLDSWLNY